jgi:hypothetical protein
MKSFSLASELILVAVCLISAMAFAIGRDFGAALWALLAGICQARFVALHLLNR